MIDLHQFASSVHSQFGEDGIIDKLLSEMVLQNGVFCEFGAWDGKHLSNTFNLYEKGWTGIYIEGDRSKFNDLKRNFGDSSVVIVNAWVSMDGESSLDNILATSLAKLSRDNVDVLSIDIDSDDLGVWKSLQTFRPSIVVVEYNPTIPSDVDFINPRGENKGNSCKSIYKHARSSDYCLVAVTETNMIFVDRLKKPASVKEHDLYSDDLFLGERYFFGYDGTMIIGSTGPKPNWSSPEIINIPWKRAFFMQPTPRRFRRYAQGKSASILLAGLRSVQGIMFKPMSVYRFAMSIMRQR